MSYKVKKGAICTKSGFPVQTVWFCDKRLAVGYDELGVNRIEYFLPTAQESNRIMFKRGIFDCFRASIVKNGVRYAPEYLNMRIYSYGLEADWNVEDDVYHFGVFTVDGNIIFTLDGDEPCDFRLIFYESTQYIPAYNGDLDSRDYGMDRKWREWQIKGNILYGGFVETKKNLKGLGVEESILNKSLYEEGSKTFQELRLGIASLSNCTFQRSRINYRWEILATHQGHSAITIVFSAENEDIEQKVSKFRAELHDRLLKQKQHYKNFYHFLPKIKTPHRTLNEFFSIAPLYHESMKGDQLGTIRAKTTHYWTWGWDSMIANRITLSCWHDTEFVKQMLKYFMNTADSEKGLVHWFRFDNSAKQYMTLSAQGFYITLLGEYIAYTNDLSVLKEFYPFTKWIFDRILETESKVKGLFIGSSLFPDFPEYLHETGRDISLFNNSIAYTAMRNMETLAFLYGDKVTAQRASRISRDTEKNFFATFYDENREYFVLSVDADTLEKRDAFSICGYLWDGNYHDDLLGKYADKCMPFIQNHGMSALAFRNYPLFGDIYDADANQLHTTWGVVEEVILRMAKYTGERCPIEQWIDKVEYWTKKLTCPEGESYEYETKKPFIDRWNCELGTWQSYTIRKWYEEILGIVCGITFDSGGIEFITPHCTFELTNVTIGNYQFAIKTQGAGNYISCLEVNGNRLIGTQKIPFDMLSKYGVNKINILLDCSCPEKRLVKAYNVRIENYCFDNGCIRFTAEGVGSKYLYINGAENISVNGVTTKVKACKNFADGYICLDFESGKSYLIEM